MVDLTRDGGALGDACHRLRSRATLLVLGSIAFVGGLVLNWLVAVGIAPLLLTALPCVAMCALGLCMTRSSESRADISPAPPTKTNAAQHTTKHTQHRPMRRSNYVMIATVLAGSLSMATTLRAQIQDSPARGMMDMGPGTMKGMGRMMEQCNQMMQGSSARPNEQWKKEGALEPNDKRDEKR